jgi:mannose-6-phosphate isomerase-like protein (cupin superfamily)
MIDIGAPWARSAARVDEAIGSCFVERVRLEDRQQFVTADRSLIRELVGIPSGNSVQQSIAEATVPPGAETVEHYHRTTEEVYLFTSGEGRMRLGEEEADVRAGDTVVIAPGVRHKLWNTSSQPLVLLCCCAPPYRDADTVPTD